MVEATKERNAKKREPRLRVKTLFVDVSVSLVGREQVCGRR